MHTTMHTTARTSASTTATGMGTGMVRASRRTTPGSDTTRTRSSSVPHLEVHWFA
jgi:hypothetical protein